MTSIMHLIHLYHPSSVPYTILPPKQFGIIRSYSTLLVFAARPFPWEQWGGEHIPPYTTADDRRRVREDRVAEKQGQRERQREEVERRRREEERERRWVR